MSGRNRARNPEPTGEGGSGDLEVALLGAGDFPAVRPAELEPWLAALVGELAPGADSVTVRLTDDEAMRGYNERFRGKDASTDVLSFTGQDGPEGRHLGDVLISVPTARRQAREAGCSLEEELRRLEGGGSP